MKKWICVALGLFLISLCGCTGQQKSRATNPLAVLAQQYRADKIAEYDSPYTACYKEKDGSYDFYIFSSPVQYQTADGYAVIENDLVEATGDYAYRNRANSIDIWFPRQLTEPFLIERGTEKITFTIDQASGFGTASRCSYENLYGDTVDAVCYQGTDAAFYFYPTNAGIRIGVVGQKDAASRMTGLRVIFTNDASASETDRYIAFRSGDAITGLFYPCQSKEKKEASLYANQAVLAGKDREASLLAWPIGALTGENDTAVQAEAAMEFYSDKMPDSTAYSQLPHYPYLAEAYEVGNLDKGDTNHFIRLRLNYFLSTMPQNVLDASYYVKTLRPLEAGERPQIIMHKVNTQWSSTKLSWASRAEVGETIASMEQDQAGNTYFNITEYVKECFADPDWLRESYGMALSEATNGLVPQTWMATSDSALYPPYVKLRLAKAPVYFEGADSINNVEF